MVRVEQRVGFARRTGAALVDVLLITALSTLVAPIIGGLVLAALGWLTGVRTFRTLGHLAVFVLVLGFLLTLRASRQALHDRFARTAVFKARELAT